MRDIGTLNMDATRLAGATDWDAIIKRHRAKHDEEAHFLRRAKAGDLNSVHAAYQFLLDRPELMWGTRPAAPDSGMNRVAQTKSPAKEETP